MIRARLAVESSVHSLDQLSELIGRERDAGYSLGSPSRIQPARNHTRTSWVLNLEWDSSVHGGTDGISSAVVALGDELSGRLAVLVEHGCFVMVSVIQEIEGERDDATLGISFSVDAVAWLARARAGISIDQYVEVVTESQARRQD